MSSDAISKENPEGPRPNKTAAGDPTAGSQLFLVRLWLEEEGEKADEGEEGALTWHGKVQHVIRGEAHAFSGLDMMVACLQTMLRGLPGPAQAMAKEQMPETQVNKDNTDSSPIPLNPSPQTPSPE